MSEWERDVTFCKEFPAKGTSRMSVTTRKSVVRLNRALRPIVEMLESRRLLSADPLAYQNVVQTLPYALSFTSAEPGVFDQTGTQGTGFTLVQPNKNGTQYQPS